MAEAPWWKTGYFEVHYEDSTVVDKYTERFLGDGLRYEISDFLNAINECNGNINEFKLTRKDSIALADIMECFLRTESNWRKR